MSVSLPDRIQALIDKVNEAIERVESGELFDLGSIDDEVMGVCEAAENPPTLSRGKRSGTSCWRLSARNTPIVRTLRTVHKTLSI